MRPVRFGFGGPKNLQMVQRRKLKSSQLFHCSRLCYAAAANHVKGPSSIDWLPQAAFPTDHLVWFEYNLGQSVFICIFITRSVAPASVNRARLRWKCCWMIRWPRKGASTIRHTHKKLGIVHGFSYCRTTEQNMWYSKPEAWKSTCVKQQVHQTKSISATCLTTHQWICEI